MSNRGMKLKPKSLGLCPSCDRLFRKEIARELYCSIHCAIWPRIEKRGPDECWPWKGGLVGGYGAGTFRKQRYRVSREVLAEKLGAPLGPGIQALHSCDNPMCCNPAHLFGGTAADNMADKVAKGRWKGVSPKLKGEAHGRAKLTEAQVREIWAKKDTHGPTELAIQFGVPKGTVQGIRRGKNWSWLTKELE